MAGQVREERPDAVTNEERRAFDVPDSGRSSAGIAEMLSSILNSLKDPILVADLEHRIVYMNDAAASHYSEGETLLGRSLLDCHNDGSCAVIREVLEALRAGEDERLITDNEKHRIFMRAVRDPHGELIGYYERYERPGAGSE